MRRTLVWLGLGLSLPLILGAVNADPGIAAGAGPGAGCDPARPVIAHHAGGIPLAAQPSTLPVPCGVRTGFGGSESRIAVTASGAVVYEPAVISPGPAGLGYLPDIPGPRFQTSASPAGLAISHDQGGSWSFVKPAGMTWESQDHQGFVDRATGRFFWYALNANPVPQRGIGPLEQPPGEEAHLLWTPDDGLTWTHASACCPAFSENPRFAAAPPPPGGRPTLGGYPNVVYFCANSSILLVSPAGARVCSRSLDGGTTWTATSVLFTKPVPRHTECGAHGEDFAPTDGNYPQAASDGSLYVKVECGGLTFLARSTDEGASWPILRRPLSIPGAPGATAPLQIPAGDELRLDTADNLYLFRHELEKVTLRVSRDRGLNWSPQLDVVAPGVSASNLWYVAVRQPGHVAVSYLGQAQGHSGLDGYLTETSDALGVDPVFFSAALNDPSRPLMTSTSLQGAPSVLVDYVGADIAPDGTPWASFVEDCGPSPADPSCTSRAGQTAGFAGRLAQAQP
ncbi:MAG: sialidase family protein [Acidimicrobiales bacterium]